MLRGAPQRRLPSALVAAVLIAAARRAMALPGVVQDAVLYLASAVFAGVTIVMAVSADYRLWGEIAGISYLVGGLGCVLVAALARRREASSRVGSGGQGGGRALDQWQPERSAHQARLARMAILVFVLLGAVIVPLATELTLRAEASPGANAQPEVAVIERAGDRLASGHNPYLRHPMSVGISPSSDRRQVDDTAYFPYLPGMVPFGLLNASSLPKELRDARVLLVGFTLLVVGIALALVGGDPDRRAKVLQFLVVLPSGALPMVTGGDDLPVLALMLLGLVLAHRRQPVLAGLVVGLAGTLKFTAWPMLLLLPFAIEDRDGRRAPLRYGLSVLAVVGPVIGLGFAPSPASFLVNVVRFPLGLARIKSPAASPLFGQVLVSIFPEEKTLIVGALLALGAGTVLYSLCRYPPRSAVAVARFTAFAMMLATVLAPATRFGYLIYPINLVVWAYLLDVMPGSAPRRATSPPGGQSASLISYNVSETDAVGAL